MIISGYNSQKVESIARNCGSDSVRKTIAFVRAAAYYNNGFVCEIFDDVAFFAGTLCKSHFRLYEMAVIEEFHGIGYGRAMLLRIKQICSMKGIGKITLRTSKSESAIEFYKKNGGTIVGEKNNDFEVEIIV